MQAAEDADILLQAVEAWLEEATGGVPWDESDDELGIGGDVTVYPTEKQVRSVVEVLRGMGGYVTEEQAESAVKAFKVDVTISDVPEEGGG